MINKYTNKQRGLLAVIMAMVMVFAGAAFVTAEVDASDRPGVTNLDGLKGELDDGDVASDGIYTLTKNVTIKGLTPESAFIINEDITIIGNGKFTLTLNGYMQIGSNTDHDDTVILKDVNIVVVNNAGIPEAISGTSPVEYEQKDSQILNYGSLTLDGCIFSGTDAEYAVNSYDGSTITAINTTNFAGKKLTVHDTTTVDITGSTNVYLNFNENATVEIFTGTGACSAGMIKISETTTIDSLSVRSGSEVTLSTDLSVGKVMGRDNGKVTTSSNSSIINATIMQYEDKTSSITLENVKFKGVNTVQKGIETTLTDVVVDENAKLTIAKEANIDASSDITNKGTVNLYSDAGTISNEGNGSVNILSKDVDTTNGTNITGGTVDTSAVNSNVNIDGDVSGNVTYDMYQTVTVVGDMNIVDNGALTVNGTLIIKEGVTLTIEDGDVGGTLTVDSIYGKVQNYGTIVVENSLIITGATVENYGIIIADSDDDSIACVQIGNNAGSGTLINEGTFEITDGDLVSIVGTIINKAGASFDIYGELNISGDIQNSGDIAIDGIVEGTINQMGDGAVVQIIELKDTTTLVVTDENFIKVGKNNLEDETNSVTIGSVEVMSGLVITTTVFTETDDSGSKTYHKEMILAGSIVNDSEADTILPITVEVLSTHMVVEDNLSIGENVIFTNESASAVQPATGFVGAFTVNGTMSVSKNVDVENTYGKLVVNGTITTDDYDITTGEIVAVEYIVVETGTADKTYYYTTLANAIDGASAAGVKKVEILGDIVVKTDVTVPAGMIVKQNTSATKVTIGDKEDVTVTVSEGAEFNTLTSDSAIDVAMGTLYIADKKTGITKNAGVKSEVKSEGEKDLRYTTLANAIAAAGSDVVTIELNGPVTVKSDLTIPANVTVDTNTQDFDVQGATLTIDGTLFLNGGTYAVTDVDNSNGTTSEGKVILNGYMKSENMMNYDGKAYPAGAYYAADLVYYITSVANSVNIINDADEDTIAIFGSNKVGDIAYAGTSDDPITINVKGDLEAKSVTVDEGTIEFFGNKFIGSITNGVGTVALNGTALNGFKVVSATDSEGTEKFTLAGEFDLAEVEDDAKENAAVISGKAILNGFEATPIIIDGEVDVIKTVDLDDVTVNGTMTIDNAQTLTVANAYVFGSIITDAPTTSKVAGAFISTNLYLGLEADDVAKNLGAVATVDGNIKVNGVMYVLAGSAFPADLVKEDTPAVELYVEGKLWMTIYNFDNSSVTVNQIPVENVEFMGWAEEEGKPGYAVDGTTVNKNFTIDFDNEKYYADIDYDVYKVTFVTAVGINDVYVDGILVDGFVMVAAGAHTVSYTLDNGYTGEAKMLVDGKEVSGYTFTTEGEFENVTYTITLQGIEKAPAEVGGGDAPVADKDEGMDLTDILLIVLVVLIVIMAIIVALRMMRS